MKAVAHCEVVVIKEQWEKANAEILLDRVLPYASRTFFCWAEAQVTESPDNQNWTKTLSGIANMAVEYRFNEKNSLRLKINPVLVNLANSFVCSVREFFEEHYGASSAEFLHILELDISIGPLCGNWLFDLSISEPELLLCVVKKEGQTFILVSLNGGINDVALSAGAFGESCGPL